MGRTQLAAVLLGIGTSVTWGTGCWGIPGTQRDSCVVDPDCGAGQVCREARCRKACPGGTWVGEQVQVEAYKEQREAVVASCDRGLWVHYPSGIEEQISPSRLRTERKAQAK